MTRNFLFIPALSVFLTSCNSISSNRSLRHSGIKYADIDLFSLKGISELNTSSYPYFDIDSIDVSKKRVISYYSDKRWDSAIYEFHGSYWRTTNTFFADTGTMTIVKQNYKDKIIELGYWGDSSKPKLLFSVGVFKSNVQETYYLKNPREMTTTEIDQILLQDSIKQMSKDSFSIKANSLKVYSLNKNYLYNKIKYDTICYNIGAHSIFWWISFESYIDKKDKICICRIK